MRREKWWIFVLYLVWMFVKTDCESTVNSSLSRECLNAKMSLSKLRKRRHLTFPDNSDAVMTISLVKAFMTHAPSGWNIALEIDVLFPLPDASFTNAQFRRKLHHRQTREFWGRLQNALDSYHFNGRSCVLRSICEAKTSLAPPGKSLVQDILRALFRAPLEEEEFKNEIRGTFMELMEPDVCDKANDCPFSLMDFILTFNKQKH